MFVRRWIGCDMGSLQVAAHHELLEKGPLRWPLQPCPKMLYAQRIGPRIDACGHGTSAWAAAFVVVTTISTHILMSGVRRHVDRGFTIEEFLRSPIGIAIVITLAITLAAFIWGRLTAEETQAGSQRFQTLPLMILVATFCSFVFLIFYALAFKASDFYAPADQVGTSGSTTSVKVPAITIAAGLFGGVLFVAFTVLKYRSHVQADEKLAIDHGEAKLKTAEHFSERFGQAAEMLGSERSATRIGGVYALAALADEWKENRQQCIDLLCGYMRTPIQGIKRGEVNKSDIEPPPHTPRDLLPRPHQSPIKFPHLWEPYRSQRTRIGKLYTETASADEIEVRRAILSSIARATRRPTDDATSWSNMSFDLSRCYLEGIDFENSKFLKVVDFNRSIFGGTTNMRGSYFAQNVQFDGCLFTGRAWFSRAVFAGHAWFRSAEFCKEVRFGETQFREGMLFNFAYFEQKPHFRDNSLGRWRASGEHEHPIANWHGVEFSEKFSGCPDDPDNLWAAFTFVEPGYRIICELPHVDSGLGVLANGHHR